MNKFHDYAQSLLADIQAASDVFLPRRDDLATWLRAFLQRSEAKGYDTAPAEVKDLIAANEHVQASRIATTARPALV